MVTSYKTSAYASYDEYVEGVLETYDKATKKLVDMRVKIAEGAQFVDINRELVTVEAVDTNIQDRLRERLNVETQAEHAYARSMVDAFVTEGFPFPNISHSFDAHTVTLGWYSAEFEVNVTVDENASCVISTVDYLKFEDSVQTEDVLPAIASVKGFLTERNVS